jgi:hypothetical protein
MKSSTIMRASIAIFTCAVFLCTLALSVSPQLHERLHPDANRISASARRSSVNAADSTARSLTISRRTSLATISVAIGSDRGCLLLFVLPIELTILRGDAGGEELSRACRISG